MRLKFFFLALSDSKPNSWYSFSWEVPLIAPVIARDALYRTLSILLLPHSFSTWSYTFVIFREKGYHLSLFWLTTENIEESSTKSFTLASRLPDKSLIHIKKNNGPKNWTLRHTRFDCQILVESEQLFVAFRIKKIRSIKVRRSLFTILHFVF